jgi:FixJ family two-component response regulator
LVAVVDDEEPIRTALRRLLNSADFGVVTYSSGTEFLESLKAGRPDAVILDLHMPQTDGFTVLSQMAKMKLRLPVIVITGHDTELSRSRSMVGGAAAYLTKPVDHQTLLAAISAALASKPETSVAGEAQ